MCFPPENSSCTQSFENDLFELIENDITLFSENGSVIIMGDMNARTGNASEPQLLTVKITFTINL
jgi:endonuclease/exonuclease/phosphatase family metal-dependent hydrolase